MSGIEASLLELECATVPISLDYSVYDTNVHHPNDINLMDELVKDSASSSVTRFPWWLMLAPLSKCQIFYININS
jgi:hypothetical protein